MIFNIFTEILTIFVEHIDQTLYWMKSIYQIQNMHLCLYDTWEKLYMCHLSCVFSIVSYLLIITSSILVSCSLRLYSFLSFRWSSMPIYFFNHLFSSIVFRCPMMSSDMTVISFVMLFLMCWNLDIMWLHQRSFISNL